MTKIESKKLELNLIKIEKTAQKIFEEYGKIIRGLHLEAILKEDKIISLQKEIKELQIIKENWEGQYSGDG